MSSIKENISRIRWNIPSHVELIVVTKTQSNERLMEAYDAGERVFGENRVQELVPKQSELPKDIEWHMIGHLQSNKVKYIAPFVSCIHSVDKTELLSVINKEAAKNDRAIRVLLQFHIAKEKSKFGLQLEEVEMFLSSNKVSNFQNLQFAGVMGMATYTDDLLQIRNEFKSLKEIFATLKQNHFSESPEFKEISMGMSGDYQIAIEEGSTMVRVGSSIFGNRV